MLRLVLSMLRLVLSTSTSATTRFPTGLVFFDQAIIAATTNHQRENCFYLNRSAIAIQPSTPIDKIHIPTPIDPSPLPTYPDRSIAPPTPIDPLPHPRASALPPGLHQPTSSRLCSSSPTDSMTDSAPAAVVSSFSLISTSQLQSSLPSWAPVSTHSNRHHISTSQQRCTTVCRHPPPLICLGQLKPRWQTVTPMYPNPPTTQPPMYPNQPTTQPPMYPNPPTT